MKQLSSRPEPLDEVRLRQILAGDTAVYVARVDGRIVGSVSRLEMRHPVRTNCWIEDLVVDENYRGMKIAQRLMEMAVAEAPAEAVNIGLSSKVERAGSHRLYEKLGFVERDDSHMWRLKLR
jgi:GNAT superfamily N-acetyltransferase